MKKKHTIKVLKTYFRLLLDLSSGFGVISAKFEDIPILDSKITGDIHSFIESKLEFDIIQPIPFTVFQYSEVKSAFRYVLSKKLT